MPVWQRTVIISGPLSSYRRTTCTTTGVYRFKVDLSPGVPKEEVDAIIEDIASTIRSHYNVTYIEATPPRPT
jgi:hypothetical protein